MVLPDGSKRLIPQAWTDAEPDAEPDAVSDAVSDALSEGSTLGSLEDLLAACALVAGLERVPRILISGCGRPVSCSIVMI